MKYILLISLVFSAFQYNLAQENNNSETEDYSEYRNQISPPPARTSSVEEFNIIVCDSCVTAKDKKLYFDEMVLSLFNNNISQEDLVFLTKINSNNRLRENLFFEFDLSGNLIKDKTESYFTYKRESEIIDSILIKFPKLSFNKFMISSSFSSIRYGVEIDYTISETDNGLFTLEKYKRDPSVGMAFHEIDEFPVYKDCDSTLNNTSLKHYMSKKINTIIGENFNTNIASEVKVSPGKKRIFVKFTISKTGEVIDIQARGPHPALEKEAKRVVSLIPKFDKPGYYGDKPVDVKYSLPIVFQVTE